MAFVFSRVADGLVKRARLAVVLAVGLPALSCVANAQQHQPPIVPPLARRPDAGPASAPNDPPTRPFRDRRYNFAFQVPSGWQVTDKDSEVSNFHMDARSSTRSTRMRAVASIAYNPFPLSTFAGAYFYASVTPRTSAAACDREAEPITGLAHTGHNRQYVETTKPVAITLGGTTFTHGFDQHGGMCIEARDNVYTTVHAGSCYRFDLLINTFCGGEVSGVKEITEKELYQVQSLLTGILTTVNFGAEPKTQRASSDGTDLPSSPTRSTPVPQSAPAQQTPASHPSVPQTGTPTVPARS